DGPERLRALLRGSGPATEAAVALLAELMAMPAAARAEAPHADAQRTRALLLEALVTNLERLAQDRPLLLLLEGAHWSDPTSQQLLDLIVERIGPSAHTWPLLLAVTCRPGYQPEWMPRAALIELRPLAAADAEALVGHIPGGERLAPVVAHGIAL